MCWLHHENFLPKYINNARVLVWGYNASFSTLVSDKKPSKDRIHHHAQTLVAQLYADRKVGRDGGVNDSPASCLTDMYTLPNTAQLERRVDKPIVFLCHSLGGIIVKRVSRSRRTVLGQRASSFSYQHPRQALSYSTSRTSAKIAHIHSISTCTYGILFFGTPHHGSSKARLLGTLQKLGSIALPQKLSGGHFESDLVSALEEESETLQNVTDYFVPLMKNFQIYFFWEQEKTDLVYTKDYIVDQESAAPSFDDTERSGIAADHSGMVKFDSNTSQGFRSVVAALDRYCEDAATVIRRRWDNAMQTQAEERRREAVEMFGSIPAMNEIASTSQLPRSAPAPSFQGRIEGELQTSGVNSLGNPERQRYGILDEREIVNQKP